MEGLRNPLFVSSSLIAPHINLAYILRAAFPQSGRHFHIGKCFEVPCIRGFPDYYQNQRKSDLPKKRADHRHLRGPATVLTPGNWKDGSDEALAMLING
jgi:hypothetical protein